MVQGLRFSLLSIALLAWCTLGWAQPSSLNQSPDVLRRQLATMDMHAQRQWLLGAYAAHQLETASDPQLQAIVQTLDWSVFLFPLRRWLQQNPDYAFQMLRRERLSREETLPATPERMEVRYRHHPRAVYVRWQAGGPRAGQEVLYDATVAPSTMRAHLGGVLRRLVFTVDIDGTLARSQSRHTVRDIGFQYILSQLDRERETLRTRDLPVQAAMGIAAEDGKRFIEMTLRTPGQPDFYAQSTRIRLDLVRPLMQSIECQDPVGQVFEHVVFENVQAFIPTGDAFDPPHTLAQEVGR